MSEPDSYEELTALFRTVFLREDLVLKPGQKFGDIPEWDSFKHVDVILAIEDNFKVGFSTSELDRCDSVDKLVDLVDAKRKEQR